MSRRSAARRPAKGGRRLPAFVSLPLRYPLRSFVSLGIASISTLIIVNAVALQTGRHPSPLFGSFAAPSRTASAETASATGTPQPSRYETRAAAGSRRDINALLGTDGSRTAPGRQSVPLPRPKQPPSQSASTGVTVR